MNKHYDIIFITNLPAFYKINLYNKIALQRKILVVFTGTETFERNNDFFMGEKKFDYQFLSEHNSFVKIFTLIKILICIKYNKVILGGWDEIIYWATIFLSPKKKNCLVCESSNKESITQGVKGLIKSLFLSRISLAYCSGKSQEQLLRSLKYSSKTIITKGVGIFNYHKQPPFIHKNSVSSFLYVGRLSPEKNLKNLIECFNNKKDLTLNIIGFGPLEKDLKGIANKNIIFHGAIDNKKLSKYYQENDVFILPSISEPWGLVVEEALNNNLPVIISDQVGCSDELIQEDKNGIIFKVKEKDSLEKAISKIIDTEYYNKMQYYISQTDIEMNVQHQINAYLK